MPTLTARQQEEDEQQQIIHSALFRRGKFLLRSRRGGLGRGRTLISGMLIIILDKKSFIGLIRTLGATVKKVRSIFIYMAIRIALTGIVIGNALMLALLWAQDRWHFLPLDPDSYYIDFVPVEISWQAILILNAATVFVIYLSMKLFLSRMMMSIPDMSVAHATIVINTRITITFVSSNESHLKYPAP